MMGRLLLGTLKSFQQTAAPTKAVCEHYVFDLDLDFRLASIKHWFILGAPDPLMSSRSSGWPR
jgi:hypothetical protein